MQRVALASLGDEAFPRGAADAYAVPIDRVVIGIERLLGALEAMGRGNA